MPQRILRIPPLPWIISPKFGVSTKRLNEQVKRNHLSRLRYSHNLPYVFTEYGAVMLASVLNSDMAIIVNIQIVRIFIKIRKLLETHSASDEVKTINTKPATFHHPSQCTRSARNLSLGWSTPAGCPTGTMLNGDTSGGRFSSFRTWFSRSAMG